MLANITDPFTINRDSGPKPTPREPVVGPMIGRLGSYVTSTAPHQLALRCRRCPTSRPFVARSTEDEGYGAHLLLREHWAAKHATALAAMTDAAPTAAPSARSAPKVVRPPKPTAPPARPTTGTCSATDCDNTFDTSGKRWRTAWCSDQCKRRQYRRDAGMSTDPAPEVCILPSCETPLVQGGAGRKKLYCSLAHQLDARRAREAGR